MSTHPLHNQDNTMPSSRIQNMRCKFPLGSIILLVPIIGVVLVLIYMSGAFEQWHSINPPPARPTQIIGIQIYFYQADPFILGDDGITYFCDTQAGGINNGLKMGCDWKIEQASTDLILEKCQQTGLNFSRWKKTFGEVVSCARVVMAGEFIGAPEVTYVLDSDGGLWYWAQENRGNMIFYLPGAVILGLLAGFVLYGIIAIAAALLKMRRI